MHMVGKSWYRYHNHMLGFGKYEEKYKEKKEKRKKRMKIKNKFKVNKLFLCIILNLFYLFKFII